MPESMDSIQARPPIRREMLAWFFNPSHWESPTHRMVRRCQRDNDCKRPSVGWNAPSEDALAPLRPPSLPHEAEPSPHSGAREQLMGFMLMRGRG